ncbi:MAG: substrate-binding domain-containing protein [Myxococcota bacterium]
MDREFGRWMPSWFRTWMQMQGRMQVQPRTGFGRALAIIGMAAIVGVGGIFAIGAPAARAEGRVLRIGITNALKEPGLFDALMPDFVAKSGYSVRITAREVGAIAVRARKGEVDVVLLDSPAAEEALVEEGIAVRRTPVLESRYAIVGPGADPAAIARIAKPQTALGQILRLHLPFVSRGDDSSAHERERELMRSAGFDPDARIDGVYRTGTSMRDSLRVADQRQAYILSDRATHLLMKSEIGLVPLSKPSPTLKLVHSILQLDPTRYEHPIEIEGAKALEQYLISPEVQARIASYGIDRFGEAPFAPAAARSAGSPR